MSSSDRRRVLLGLALLPLAACGFAPAYGPGGSATDLFGQVRMAPPTDKNAFDLVERLEERLGRGSGAAHRLTYRIETREFGLAITPENAISRYNVTGNAAFTLTDPAGAVRAEGLVTSFTSYSATGNTVSAVSAREDAYLRLMRILADQIVTRLTAARAPSG